MFRELNTGLIHFNAGFNQSLEGFCLVLRSDGLFCCGEFLNNQLNGKGLIWKNEQKFLMGSFNRGQIKQIDLGEMSVLEYFKWVSLQCKTFKFIKHQTNNSHYFGTIETKRKPSGLGIIIHEDGKLNHGQFYDGKLNGYCQLQLKNDDRYTGLCVSGKIQGLGVFYHAKQRQTYIGKFEQGECIHIIETSIGQPTKNQIQKIEDMVFKESLPELYLQNFEQFMLNVQQNYKYSQSQYSTQSIQFIKKQCSPAKKNQSLIMNDKIYEFKYKISIYTTSSTSSSHQTKTESKTFESCQPCEIQSDSNNRNDMLSQTSSIMNAEEEEGICRFKQIMDNLQRLQQNSYLPPQVIDLDSSQMVFHQGIQKINKSDESHQSNLPGLEFSRAIIQTKVEELSDKKKITQPKHLDNKEYKNISSSKQIPKYNNRNVKQLQFSQTMQSFQQKKQTIFLLQDSNLNKTSKGVDKSSQCYSINTKKRVQQKKNTHHEYKKTEKSSSKTQGQQTMSQSVSYRSSYSPQKFSYVRNVTFVEQFPKPAFITIRKLPQMHSSYQQWMSKSVVLSKF